MGTFTWQEAYCTKYPDAGVNRQEFLSQQGRQGAGEGLEDTVGVHGLCGHMEQERKNSQRISLQLSTVMRD